MSEQLERLQQRVAAAGWNHEDVEQAIVKVLRVGTNEYLSAKGERVFFAPTQYVVHELEKNAGTAIWLYEIHSKKIVAAGVRLLDVGWVFATPEGRNSLYGIAIRGPIGNLEGR